METFRIWPADAPALQDGIADGFIPTMDFYPSETPLPDPERGRPALVIFPGGAYVNRAPHEGLRVKKSPKECITKDRKLACGNSFIPTKL